MSFKFNPISGNFDLYTKLDNPLQFKGSISSSSEFPTSDDVEIGWFYTITVDVTDNDSTKTNTGQSFESGDEIAWNGSNWTNLGSSSIIDHGTTSGQMAYWDGSKWTYTETATVEGDDFIIKDGNLGIGTDSPEVPLQINNTANQDSIKLYNPDTETSLSFKATDIGYVSTDSRRFRFVVNDESRIDVTSTSVFLGDSKSIRAVTIYNGRVYLAKGGGYGTYWRNPEENTHAWGTDYTERLRIDPDGNIGIGTDSPEEQLEITKNFRLPQTIDSNTYGVIYKDNLPFLHDYADGNTTGRNLFIGLNAGNFTLGDGFSGGEASNNVGIGRLSLSSLTSGEYNLGLGSCSLQNCDTGFKNMALGALALYDLTSAQNNLAIGYGAGGDITTGSFNIALGGPALAKITGANSNVGIGYHALNELTTGSNNIAIGHTAGKLAGDGNDNIASYKSIFIGRNAYSDKSGRSNQIVIGDQAIGSGSNTVTLGNDDVVKTVLKGNVGIGTNSPDTTLHNTGAYTQEPLSTDPDDPDDGNSVTWVSDGMGSGNPGDVMIKINVGGTVKTVTLVDFSSL